MSKQSHYPDYDVMREQDAWDDHTRTIVISRLTREKSYTFLSTVEAEIVRSVCSVLIHDDRSEVMQFVVSHVDEELSKPFGEGQRNEGVPKADVLIRDGLKRLDKAALYHYKNSFIGLDKSLQHQLLQELSLSVAEPDAIWQGFDQKSFFQKMLNLTLDAYYSHPAIWSEIGYGGPAYPRGYIRTHLGQIDPWEAKRQT